MKKPAFIETMPYFIAGVMIVAVMVSFSWAAEKKPPKPGPRDKCPVCGMFVAKYPDFIAAIAFRNGSYAYFDGAKDMFKFYFDTGKYNPGTSRSEIESVIVTDYYSLAPIDGFKASYVVGSDVYGPMGKELIPFEKRSDAEGFMKDHKGKKVLLFRDVTPSIMRDLD